MMPWNSDLIHEAAYIVSTFTVSRLPGKMWHHTVRQEILKVGPKLASGYFQFGSDYLAEREWHGNSLLTVVSTATQHTVQMNCLSGAIISNLQILIMHGRGRCFEKKPHLKAAVSSSLIIWEGVEKRETARYLNLFFIQEELGKFCRIMLMNEKKKHSTFLWFDLIIFSYFNFCHSFDVSNQRRIFCMNPGFHRKGTWAWKRNFN